MDTSDSKLVESILNGTSQTGDSALSEPVTHLIKQFQPQIQLFLTVSIILTVLIAIAFIIMLIYRIRVERAILRIDKNIQKLVAVQDTKSPVSDIEQK
jgi:uncharacterized membrane protein